MIFRGIAAFFGSFAILNLIGNRLAPGFDANIWWIDFSPLPKMLSDAMLLLGGLALLIHAFRPARGLMWRLVVAIPIAVLSLVALGDAVRFYRLLQHHAFETAVAFPFSALICGITGLIAVLAIIPAPHVPGWRGKRLFVAAFLGCIITFPLAQMFFFGNTDYRRKADVIVVFGARAHADGSPSGILADRVLTACQLYRDGKAPLLYFSGGPGDGAIDEPQAMRQLAISQGIPYRAIVLDHDGLNTSATVRNSTALFEKMHIKRVLAVSHSYHLPRVKMSYRQAGWNVYTVPAVEHFRTPARVKFIGREMVALWAYYLHPLVHLFVVSGNQ